MNPQIEFNLAVILFLPWFAILATLYWWFPRQPRGPARYLFDVAALTIAGIAAFFATHWGMTHADPRAGGIWKQVLATSVAYGVFLAVMTLAIVVRRLWLGRQPAPSPDTPA